MRREMEAMMEAICHAAMICHAKFRKIHGKSLAYRREMVREMLMIGNCEET